MKQFFKTMLLAVAFVGLISTTNVFMPSTVRQQLEQAHKEWIGKQVEHQDLNAFLALPTDCELISKHLEIVEQSLRKKTTTLELGEEQKQARLHCLDVLHDYWQQADYPRNPFFAQRTPYFLDVFNSKACAVANLMAKTGQEELVNCIAQQNNFEFVRTLAPKYPEILTWAKQNGFSLDELAWIQVPYMPVSPAETEALLLGMIQTAYDSTQAEQGNLCSAKAFLDQSQLNAMFFPTLSFTWDNSVVGLEITEQCPGTHSLTVAATNGELFASVNFTIEPYSVGTSTDLVSNLKEARVYPTIASSNVYITLPDTAEPFTLYWHDGQGRAIQTPWQANKSFDLDISQASVGMHFLTLQQGKTQKTIKFMKQ